MAKFTEHFSGTVRSTKDALRHGPLKVRRVNAIPPNTFGRNSDIVIVDDTAESVENIAENRVPVDSLFCQKIPLTIVGGTFTIAVTSGVFTITIATIDDVVEQINRAEIPGVHASLEDRSNIFITCPGVVTFADGASDFPSITGIAGPNSGELTVATGSWECQIFPASIEILDEGISLGQFNAINFIGAGITAINAGGGRTDVTVGGGGGGGPAYGEIVGDTGTATAVVASETITFGGIGIDVVATNAGAGLDTISFNMDIADLPAAAGTPAITDEIAIDDGAGTTERHPLSAILTAQGLAITIINGQPMLTLEDTTRGNKILSVGEQALQWSEKKLGNQDWIDIGDASDADTGWIADFDGTIVYASGHCENTKGNSKDIRIYVNAIDTVLAGTLIGGANVTFNNTTLNTNFIQGDRLRLRAINGAGGNIEDSTIKLTVKWRG